MYVCMYVCMYGCICMYDLTQLLLSHAHSVAVSVRPTFGSVIIYGVIDVFVVRDGLP